MWFVMEFVGTPCPWPCRTAIWPEILLLLFDRKFDPQLSQCPPFQEERRKKTNFVVLPDLANHRVERLVDVDGLLGGCFHEDAPEVFCQITTLYIIIDQSVCISNDTIKRNGVEKLEGISPSGRICRAIGKTKLRGLTVHADLTLVLEVALISDEDHREIVLVLYPKNLLMKLVYLLERFPRGYRVHEDEAFSGPHVLFAHGPIRKRIMVRDDGQRERERERACACGGVTSK